MLNNTLTYKAIDTTTDVVYTKVIQDVNGSIFKRNSLPFGTSEELKINSQVTKKGRHETLIDLNHQVRPSIACDTSDIEYVRVFIKIDRPGILSPELSTALNEAINILNEISGDTVVVPQILNGES